MMVSANRLHKRLITKLSVPQFGRPPSVVSSVYQLREDISYTPNFVRFLTLLVSFGSQLWFASFTMIGLNLLFFFFFFFFFLLVDDIDGLKTLFLASPCCVWRPFSTLSGLIVGVFDFAVALWQVSGTGFDFICTFLFLIFLDDQIAWWWDSTTLSWRERWRVQENPPLLCSSVTNLVWESGSAWLALRCSRNFGCWCSSCCWSCGTSRRWAQILTPQSLLVLNYFPSLLGESNFDTFSSFFSEGTFFLLGFFWLTIGFPVVILGRLVGSMVCILLLFCRIYFESLVKIEILFFSSCNSKLWLKYLMCGFWCPLRYFLWSVWQWVGRGMLCLHCLAS